MKPRFLILACVLSACATQSVETPAMKHISKQFRYLPSSQKSNIYQWYSLFNDPTLTHLIEQGIEHNFTIQAAQNRVLAAQSYTKAIKADLLPTVGVSGNLGHQDISIDNPLKNNAILSPHLPSKITTDDGLVMLGFSASWEPDFFGQKTADTDAVRFQSQEAEYQTAYLKQAIVAKIAVEYFQISAHDATMQLIDSHIKTLQELHRYAASRFNAGQASKSDVLEIQTTINKLTAQKTAVKALRDEQEQQLAVLTGQSPQTFRLPENATAINATLPILAGFVPSDLLQLRPDILAKAAAVQSSAAKVASAKADLLPRFQLQFLGETGKIGLSTDGVHFSGTLFNAGVQIPIFTGGKIRHNIKGKEAELQAAMADYQQQVLNALQEVDTAYNTRILLEKRLNELQTAQKTAQQRHTSTQRLFHNGYAQYNEVLRAKLDALQIEQEILTAKRDRVLSSVALYRALGGKPQ
ncbi:MAG: efflux transporter outer membrane subunit [Neisseriaceae bacterium]|nr:efflux transporter outer membrane subunit [Neisseriaceae bacterium]